MSSLPTICSQSWSVSRRRTEGISIQIGLRQRARYLVPKGDFDFFTSADSLENFPYIKDQILPLVDLGLVDYMEPETDLTPEVRVWGTPGHTPGHVCFLITSAGELFSSRVLGEAALALSASPSSHF